MKVENHTFLDISFLIKFQCESSVILFSEFFNTNILKIALLDIKKPVFSVILLKKNIFFKKTKNMATQNEYQKKNFSNLIKRLEKEHGGHNIINAVENNNYGLYFDQEIEEAVIGAILIEPEAYYQISDILQPDYFYVEKLGNLYAVIQEMASKNKPIDILTVFNYCKSKNFIEEVSAYEISKLTHTVSSTYHLLEHTNIVIFLFVKRELHKTFTVGVNMLKTEDVSDVLSYFSDTLFEIECVTSNKVERHVSDISADIVTQYITRFEELKRTNQIPGITTGFDSIDKNFKRHEPGELVILAARPGMGKTSLALCMAVNIAKKGIPTAFFTLEMADVQIVKRNISLELNISYEKLENLDIDNAETYDKFVQNNWSNYPLYIDDTSGISNIQLESKIRRLIMKYGVQVVFVDYLQLMQSSQYVGNKTQEITYISAGLKSTAKKLKIPIIALSQLSRETDKRSGFRPRLSDLRDSGAIEQDADKVFFIHRPEYYGLLEDEQGNSTIGVAEFICEKNRNGRTGSVSLFFDGETTSFKEYETQSFSNEMPNF